MNSRAAARMRGAAVAAAVIAIAVFAPGAHGQVYKCTDGNGRTVYADSPCGGASAPMRLPQDPTKSTSSPTACAQLEDELHRLGAQAERDAERGRKPNSGDAKRRQSLGKQYAERCQGITLSRPAPK